ncbi:MAG TPA: cellulase family glycosylhydrolase [Candidatus Dormibacteraeota bacterium]|nr:cellulase family glycosylhydrolase [Candidatus Dormibacteraeota bacterium]
MLLLGLLVIGVIVTGSMQTHALAAVRQGGINAEPSMRPWRYMGMNPDSWWCQPPNCYQNPNPSVTINTELSLMRQLNVAVVRVEFPWYQMEPSQGSYDWSRSDLIVNAAIAHGVQLQPIIVYTPRWAAAAPTNLPTPAQYSSFVRAIVGRYHGSIHYWEMWNEPNYGFNGGGYLWPASVSDYVNDILNPGYAAAHAADPRAQVMFGGPSSPDLSWLATVISTGNFDIAAFHDYGNPTGDSVGVEALLQQYGKGNRPLWVGEYGAQENSVNDVNQQNFIKATLTSSSPIAMALWYNLRDDNSMLCCPQSVAHAAYWGVVQHDNVTLKAGFATMASLLGGSSPPPAAPPPAAPPSAAPPPAAPPSPTSAPSLTPSASPSAAPPPISALPATTGGMHVQGNQIVDAKGNVVRLRGANMAGTEFVCAQGWSADPFGGQPEDSPATFAAMQAWHINFVRVPLNEDCWLGINGARIGGAAYQTAIVKLVHDLRAAGFYVIVDLHWSAPGTQLALSQNPVPDKDHSPAFWSSVAATFSNDLGVIYDLFNEPFLYWIAAGGPDQFTCLMNGCTLNQYETGGTPFTITANWQSAGMNELIGDVRATGAQNVIMVAGANWARDLSGWLAHRPADTNVAASWHSYPSGNPTLISECAAQSCWDSVVAPLAQQVPVVVGETGDSTFGPQTYLPAFLPWANTHGLSVVAWTWNAWTNPDDVLVTDMQTGNPTSGEGVFYKAWIAGQPLPSPAPAPSPSSTPSPSPAVTPSPSPSPSPSSLPPPSPTPTSNAPVPVAGAPGVLLSDNFQNDPRGSLPAGWTAFGANSVWSVQSEGSHVLNHAGWTGSIRAGSSTWSNYLYTVAVKPSCWASEHDGLLFAMHEGGFYTLDIIGGNKLVLEKTVHGTVTVLATAFYTFNPSLWYNVSVSLPGGSITAYVNGAPVLHANDSTFTSGAIGLEANDPVAFDNVVVTQPGTSTPAPVTTPRK